MKQYEVTGMSCAACSARVEKAVSKIEGVTSCSVNLLTNSMGVEGAVDAQTVIEAVEAAGYKAAEKESRTGQEAGRMEKSGELKDKETPEMKKRLIASLCFLIPLMYLSMGHMMWGWKVPEIVSENHVAMGIIQLLLTTSGISGRKSCGDGAGAAPVNDNRYGDQSEVFYQWSQRTFS